MPKPLINQTRSWKALQDHYAQISEKHMRDLFVADESRAEYFSLRQGPILFDYS